MTEFVLDRSGTLIGRTRERFFYRYRIIPIGRTLARTVLSFSMPLIQPGDLPLWMRLGLLRHLPEAVLFGRCTGSIDRASKGLEFFMRKMEGPSISAADFFRAHRLPKEPTETWEAGSWKVKRSIDQNFGAPFRDGEYYDHNMKFLNIEATHEQEEEEAHTGEASEDFTLVPAHPR